MEFRSVLNHSAYTAKFLSIRIAASRHDSLTHVKQHVIGVILANDQILIAVVVAYLIEVVDFYTIRQWMPNCGFGDDNVLQNVAVGSCAGMARLSAEPVALADNRFVTEWPTGSFTL